MEMLYFSIVFKDYGIDKKIFLLKGGFLCFK